MKVLMATLLNLIFLLGAQLAQGLRRVKAGAP